jgi:hypothetical protein
LALKRNHETLHREVVEFIDQQLEGELEEAQELTTTQRGHGRVEERTYLHLPVPKALPGPAEWKGLKSVGLVTSRCVQGGKERVEVRYYLSSLAVDVAQLARAVRGHWSVENPQPEYPRVSVHAVDPEAAPRPATEPDHEATGLRMERQVADGSHWRINMLVCAGPGLHVISIPIPIIRSSGANLAPEDRISACKHTWFANEGFGRQVTPAHFWILESVEMRIGRLRGRWARLFLDF